MNPLDAASVALVVEDDDVLRQVMDEMLRAAGYMVLTRDTIAGARSILECLRPDVLVIDFNLRGEVGTELLEHLASDDDPPPTILVSASTLASDAAERFAIELVKKPFDVDDLLRRIASTIARRSRPSIPAGVDQRVV